jgi:flagellar assembly protein FliH
LWRPPVRWKQKARSRSVLKGRMNTSSSRAAGSREVRGFSYREVRGGERGRPAQDCAAVPQVDASGEALRQSEAQARASFEQLLTKEREAVQRALSDFERERGEYYQKVEFEVVQLALAIARRVLHREASADPLLLAAIARVALDKLENKTEVVLRVHPDSAAHWRAFFASTMEPHHVPEILEDPTLEKGRYILQTVLGSTELGLEPQLKEVEETLLDLQMQRPKVVG